MAKTPTIDKSRLANLEQRYKRALEARRKAYEAMIELNERKRTLRARIVNAEESALQVPQQSASWQKQAEEIRKQLADLEPLASEAMAAHEETREKVQLAYELLQRCRDYAGETR
ncbi:hypothetical protein AB2N04_14670 [Nitratireductor sp. GISD-1A_MAKvit]|uniref:hypothetical protein n=1 Tax=Nitratireductor sp. GISD-1A_MAKvit TaxID=3234198 RepID=UPI003466D6C6